MGEKIKNLGSCFISFAILIGTVFIAFFFIEGGVWLSSALFPWLMWISLITFLVCILVLLPMLIFKKTRGASLYGFIIASFIFGATTWVWSFLIAYVLWGFAGLLIGLFFAGIGVVPVAILASIFSGEWVVFFQLIILLLLTFGLRFFAIYVDEKTK